MTSKPNLLHSVIILSFMAFWIICSIVSPSLEEYSPSDTGVIERIILNAMNDKMIIESGKLGLEIEKADFMWNLFLFSKRKDVDNPGYTVRAKIVNTGINRYIEFEKHLQGFQDGEILTYRRCEDGTSVIVKGGTK